MRCFLNKTRCKWGGNAILPGDRAILFVLLRCRLNVALTLFLVFMGALLFASYIDCVAPGEGTAKVNVAEGMVRCRWVVHEICDIEK